MPADRPAAASCADLVKTYRTGSGEVRALRGVTTAFERGALSVVAGPSGSGKSSLLRILACLDRPTSGEVNLDGVRLSDAGARKLRLLRRRAVGYVYQRPSDNFFPQLTIGAHLGWALRRARHRHAAAATASMPSPEDVLRLLGIADRVGHLPAQLSGGEQQRAAFAQSLFAGARIVVADEPTAELDGGSAAHMLDAMQALVDAGVTFIVASHDADVMSRAGSVIRLDHGMVAADPTADLKRPAWEAGTALLHRVQADARDDEGPAVIDVRSVSKAYHRGDETVHAVRDVSLQLLEGELVGLVGRSGSGKTTLLNVIAGWERADAGSVELSGGRQVDPRAPWSEVAVLPQKLGLIDEFTIRENIEYPARLIGALDSLTSFADELIDDLGLFALQDRFPPETSLGEQQRAALARGLILSPRLMIADEPTAHQDQQRTLDVLTAIRRAMVNGTSCLAATHSEELARSLDRVFKMSDGRLSAR